MLSYPHRYLMDREETKLQVISIKKVIFNKNEKAVTFTDNRVQNLCDYYVAFID